MFTDDNKLPREEKRKPTDLSSYKDFQAAVNEQKHCK